MITFTLISIAFIAFTVLAYTHGVESRPEFNGHASGERFGALR